MSQRVTDPMDWTLAVPILERALELPPEERARFLDESCAADDALRARLARMLDEELGDEEFLAPPFEPTGVAGSTPERWAATAGASLGPYRLVERVGAGGMGEVWLARREANDFQQRVAIKLIRLGMHTDDVLRRFRNERRVLAALTHPNIPRLFDGGATPDGRPYIVMEYVEGVALDEYVAREALDTVARLELFLKICDAVAHAHERGIVHRDIKTSNVLVTADGRPRLLDFGIAKALEGTDDLGTIDLTLTGQQVLTPRWASPEQVRGDPVGPATDVYALGLLLWQMLVGDSPVRFDALTTAELQEAVCEQSVPRPSTRAEDPTLRRRLRGDLDTIVGMALRKEPGRRYASARELADDLRRHVDERPIRARSDTMTYRTSKFVRRHRGLVAGTVTTIVALVVGLVLVYAAYVDAARADLASRRASYAASMHAAEAALRDGRAGEARANLDAAPESLRGWEWRHLASRLDRSTVVSPAGEHISFARVGWLADGSLFRTALEGVFRQRGGGARAIDGSSRYSKVDTCSASERVAWSDQVGQVWIEDTDGGGRRAVGSGDVAGRASDVVCDLAWSRDGQRLAVSRGDGSVSVIDVASGTLQHRFEEHEPSERGGRLRWHPDGRRLASAGWDETVQLYDAASGEALGGWRAHTMCVEDLDFDPDGRSLVTVSMDTSVKVWDVSTREIRARLRPHDREVQCARFLPGGDRVVTGDAAGVLRITEVESGEVVTKLVGHDCGLWELAIDPLGRRLASIDERTCVRVWDLEARDLRSVDGCEYSDGLEFSGDGERFALASPDGLVRVWRSRDLELLARIAPDCGMLGPLEWCDDAPVIVTGSSEGKLVVVDATTLDVRSVLDVGKESITAIETFDGGRSCWIELASRAGAPGRFERWDLGAGRRADGFEAASVGGFGQELVLSAAGDVLATVASQGGFAVVYDAADGPRLVGERLEQHHAVATFIDGDPETVVVVCGSDVLVHDVARRRVASRWTVEGPTKSVALRPQGDRVAVACQDRIELWDPDVPMRVATLRGHVGWIGALAWSADGRTLASSATDGRVVLWETR